MTAINYCLEVCVVWIFRLVCSILTPFSVVRTGKLQSDRLGHMVLEIEHFLRSRDIDGGNGFQTTFLFCDKIVSNRHVLIMIKRRLPVWEGRLSLRCYEILKKHCPESPVWIDFGRALETRWQVWSHARPQLRLIEDDERRGVELLTMMGLRPGNPFVCFHSRDKAYLDAHLSSRTPDGWRYHDHRDCHVENYLQAAEWLAEQGYYVLRMGAAVNRPMVSKTPRVIDYAAKYRTDFGDVYLMAHCHFFLGNTSGGLLGLARAFNVPYVLANVIPLNDKPSSHRDLFIPKKYWHKEKKKTLSFVEIFSMGADQWRKCRDFADAGIEVIENTSEEILAVTKEMKARLDGTWVSQPDDEELQCRYQMLFPSTSLQIGNPSRVGAEFLRQNTSLLPGRK